MTTAFRSFETSPKEILAPVVGLASPVEWPGEQEQRKAYHEAGHAVICFVLYGEQVIRELALHGPRVTEPGLSTFSRLPIPIVCRPSGGEPRRGNPAPVSSDAIVDAHGILQYAGGVAEALLSSGNGPVAPLNDESGQARALSDRQKLSQLSVLVGRERPVDTFYAEYWEEALRLLRTHWAGVEALAESLHRHGTFSGARTDELLCSFC